MNNQITANAGLYFVSWQLSKLGWNVMPTSRNAKGIDLVIYNQKGGDMHTIQVKTITIKNAVFVGHGIQLPSLMAEYLVICRYVLRDAPELFVERAEPAMKKAHRYPSNNSWLIEYKEYERFQTDLEAVFPLSK